MQAGWRIKGAHSKRWSTRAVAGLVVVLVAAFLPFGASASAQAAQVDAIVGADYVTCPTADFVGPFEMASGDAVCYPRAAIPATGAGTFVGVEIIDATLVSGLGCPAGTIQVSDDPVECVRDSDVLCVRKNADGSVTGCDSGLSPVDPIEAAVLSCPGGTLQTSTDPIECFTLSDVFTSQPAQVAADGTITCPPGAQLTTGDAGTAVCVSAFEKLSPVAPNEAVELRCPSASIEVSSDPLECVREVDAQCANPDGTVSDCPSGLTPVTPIAVEIAECPDGYNGPFTGQFDNALFESFARLLFLQESGAHAPTCELWSAEQVCLDRVVTVDLGQGEVPTDDGDVVLGTMQADTITLGAGDNIVCALGGSDRIIGGGGNDYILAGGGNDNITTGAGNDIVSGQPGADTIRGGADSDILLGGSGYDRLEGGNGNDHLSGSGGNDLLYGGDGDDSLYGRYGNDELWGGAGNDEIYAAGGDDIAEGGDGDDVINAGSGDDTLYGRDGADSIYGKNGADELWGGGGNDELYGGGDADEIWGDAGDDYLHGAGGIDILNGGLGNDELYGGADADTLDGGAGTNTCGISATDTSIANC